MPKYFNGGYHLSYWGTAEDIKIKIENFAHQELNTENFTDIDKINERLNTGLDLFDRNSDMVKTNVNDIDHDFYQIFSMYTK